MNVVRTPLEIDEQLMKDALRATRLKTEQDVVELGLRTLLKLRLRSQEDIKQFRGKLKWEGDLDAMRADAP
ncbi:type II toxin-antitoxin system VapB family antitoxin [Piscinibacter gummiphilus]|nr:type II toxin-antitoxin system VapB family antitoxin [Piscinibacter gummiphilus]